MTGKMTVPAYPTKPHKTGQARIRLGGKDVWLGVWGSPASRKKYARKIAEFEAAGDAVVETGPRLTANGSSVIPGVTVAQLIDTFRVFAEARYVKHGKQTSEVGMYQLATAPVLELYGDTLASEFGPLALLACRDALKAKGYCRTKINSHLGRIRRVWKFGVSRQLVAETVWRALQSVEGYRKGEVADRPKIGCAPQAAVEAINPHVAPTVWRMIQMQLLAGMRPGEVCIMRTCDILSDDPSIPEEARGVCWTYRPMSHKTEHHERGRLILLGPAAQALLDGWLRPADPEGFIFSPRESVEYFRALKAEKKKDKNKKDKRKRKADPQRVARECYDHESYARAIARACLKAKVEHWHPNQLRHSAGTRIRKAANGETTQTILGHASINMTEIYAERDIAAAAKVIAQIG